MRAARGPVTTRATAAPRTATYFYGVVAWPVSQALRRSLGAGVGDPPQPVRMVRHLDVAALVSDIPPEQIGDHAAVRGLRRDMRAHSAVLNRVTERATVLPVRFGTVLPDDDALVAHVLAPQYQRLREQLARLEGTVELSLKATYLEKPVLAEIVRDRPELARPGGSYHARIERGRRVVEAIQQKQERDRHGLLASIGRHVSEVRLREPTSELMLVNASVLLDRAALEKFDKALERAAAREAKRLQIDCVGPLPPFSFAELRV